VFEIVLASIILLSSFLAIYYEKIIYSVTSMIIVFLAISGLYFYLGAFYAGLFQLTAGLGTGIVFLLVARTLSPRRPDTGFPVRKISLGILTVLLFSITLLGARGPTSRFSAVVETVPLALWQVRFLDVLAQSLLVLVLTLGIGIVLAEEGGE